MVDLNPTPPPEPSNANRSTFILICDDANSTFSLRLTGWLATTFSSLEAALAHAESLVREETLITFHNARGQIVKTSFVGGKREDGEAAGPLLPS